MSGRACFAIYEHRLDKRHRWAIDGTPEDMTRTARCRVCQRTQGVYGMIWLRKFYGRFWADLPHAIVFGQFLHPDTVERKGRLVVINRARALSLPGRAE